MNLDQQPTKHYDWIDIAQLVISILAFFQFLSWAGLMGLLACLGGKSAGLSLELSMVINMVLTALLFSVIALVSIISTIQKIRGVAKPRGLPRSGVLLFSILLLVPIFGLAALAGLASAKVRAIAYAVLAIPAIAIPVFWLLRLGARGQKAASPKRESGFLIFSFKISTPYILIIEMILFIFLGTIFMLSMMGKPEFMELLSKISANPEWLASDPSRLFTEYQSLFHLPTIIGLILLTVAGIMPVVEELFKTIGVWLLKVRNPDPSESFRAGLLCGAGFALFEGLLSVNSLALKNIGFSEWAGLMLGRFGGSLLHILSGGMIGLAIGKFWQNRKFGSLFLAYLISWSLHAAWNVLAVVGGINPLLQGKETQSPLYIVGLVVLFAGMLLIFFRLIAKAARTTPQMVDSQEAQA